ncbi:MAG: isoleucine--tRNA ligase, partial [Muribaculaceae bacterium]|nr:isoleucine--tRNA ligase [Muribaculaceae bacterium]
AQIITSLILSLRRKANIKVRQPLQEIMIPVVDDHQRDLIESMKALILNEVNVKNLKLVASDEGVLVKKVKPDFKKLGPKFGKQMKAVAKAIAEMSQQQINILEADRTVTLQLDGPVVIDAADVEIISEDIPGWLVANQGNITVALDVTVTPELRCEGIAREIVNRIQNIRKGRDYEITDRINVVFEPNEITDDAIKEYAEYIAAQVLANSIVVEPLAEDAPGVETLDIDEINLRVSINK